MSAHGEVPKTTGFQRYDVSDLWNTAYCSGTKKSEQVCYNVQYHFYFNCWL